MCTDGSDGSVSKGLDPVTKSWLKSAANDFAKSYASLTLDTFGLVKASAPRAQTIAAFWRPAGSRASASTDSAPKPIGMRGIATGIGVVARSFSATEAPTEAARDRPAAISSVRPT